MGSDAWRVLAETHLAGLPTSCGEAASPGVVDADEWRDWSEFDTTPDQLRIEAYLDCFDLRGKHILHVGVGNSGLAQRFHRRAGAIVGTTVVPAEQHKGAALGLPNYEVLLHNKYSGQNEAVSGLFDVIVDNNPTTFCCCLKHLRAMLEWYAASLAPGGQIVTDRVGLGWVTEVPTANARWRFSFDDLAVVAPLIGLTAYRVNAETFVLSRGRPAKPGVVAQAHRLLRRVRGFVAR